MRRIRSLIRSLFFVVPLCDTSPLDVISEYLSSTLLSFLSVLRCPSLVRSTAAVLQLSSMIESISFVPISVDRVCSHRYGKPTSSLNASSRFSLPGFLMLSSAQHPSSKVQSPQSGPVKALTPSDILVCFLDDDRCSGGRMRSPIVQNLRISRLVRPTCTGISCLCSTSAKN